MARTKWADVRRTLSPEHEAAGRAEVQAELAAMKLAELRHARRLSQATIAEVLDMRQGDVSKLERRTDAYVSTLRRFIEATGGSLQIIAKYPDSEPIEIIGFSSIDPPQAVKEHVATTKASSKRDVAQRRRRRTLRCAPTGLRLT
jgi:transcriptional regulator with XRE-family HTH domain